MRITLAPWGLGLGTLDSILTTGKIRVRYANYTSSPRVLFVLYFFGFYSVLSSYFIISKVE